MYHQEFFFRLVVAVCYGLPQTLQSRRLYMVISGLYEPRVLQQVYSKLQQITAKRLTTNLSLQTRAFFVNFLIGGCGSGACKWRACFPAFISGFYCKKQEK